MKERERRVRFTSSAFTNPQLTAKSPGHIYNMTTPRFSRRAGPRFVFYARYPPPKNKLRAPRAQLALAALEHK